MESPQRQEEQHETEEDEPAEKSADPEDVGGRGRRRRPRDREQEKSDEDKVPEREGERQSSERLEPEECVFIIRAQRERSAAESMDAQGDTPERPDDRGEPERRHRQRQDVVNRCSELEPGTGAGVEHERGRARAEDRRGADRYEKGNEEQEPGDELGSRSRDLGEDPAKLAFPIWEERRKSAARFDELPSHVTRGVERVRDQEVGQQGGGRERRGKGLREVRRLHIDGERDVENPKQDKPNENAPDHVRESKREDESLGQRGGIRPPERPGRCG